MIKLHNSKVLHSTFPQLNIYDAGICHDVQDWFETCFQQTTYLIKSCTAGFEIMADYLNICPGDEVIAPAYAFPSIVQPFIRRGGSVKLIDSEKDRPHIDVGKIWSEITERTKAIILIHYGGIPCNLDEVYQIKGKFEHVIVIEDSAHAIGVDYKEKPLGTHFDVGLFSFHSTKNVSCFEGGAITIGPTLDKKVVQEIIQFGTNRVDVIRGSKDKYQWTRLGGAHLLAQPLANMLLPQLESLAKINDRRKRIADQYDYLINLENDKIVVSPLIHSHTNGHIYPLVIVENKVNSFLNHLRVRGVESALHYASVSNSNGGRRFINSDEYPNAAKFNTQLIRVPIFYGMSNNQVEFISETINEVLDNWE